MREHHGMTDTPEHQAWMNMIQRCENPNAQMYARYGGRGIRVCDRWRQSFAAFFSDVGPRPSEQHSIDRIDHNGNYEPGNVRWADLLTQQRNVSKTVWITINGERKCAREWSRISGIDHKVIIRRFRRGVDENELLAPAERREESMRGVYFHKRSRKWQVRVGKRNVGTFPTMQQAIDARDAAQAA